MEFGGHARRPQGREEGRCWTTSREGGDDVELDCLVTLEGYTQIEPKTTLIRAGSAADAPWTCELLMRKYYVSLDVVDGNGKRVPGAGVELRSSSDVVAYQPRDVAEQAPQPIQLDTAYDVRPIISSLKGAGGEYFFRDPGTRRTRRSSSERRTSRRWSGGPASP